MHFHFQANRANGEQVHSRITADGFQDAQAKLRARGFTNVQLTVVDQPSRSSRESSPPPPPTFFSLGNLLVIGLIIALVVGLSAYLLENRGGEEEAEDSFALSDQPFADDDIAVARIPSGRPEVERNSPPPQPQEIQRSSFDADHVRNVLLQVLTHENTRVQDQVSSIVFITSGDAKSVSIQEGREVGYEYDIIVPFTAIIRVQEFNGESVIDPDVVEGTFVYHVSEDYRLCPQYGFASTDSIHMHSINYMASFKFSVSEIVEAVFQEFRQRQ